MLRTARNQAYTLWSYIATSAVPGSGFNYHERRMPEAQSISLTDAFLGWFREQNRQGLLQAIVRCFALLWEFAIDSLPARRRQRYGDVDYDWDFRVDTTSATVGWRDRLLGMLTSPYQPTDPALFHEMLDSLKIDFRDFTFIDIGSGKGRTLLMASDYPFRLVLGVELLPELHRVAQENIAKYKSDSQKCLAIESICGDASDFKFPPGPLLIYLFNPLPEAGLIRVLDNLERSVASGAYVIYHNPLLQNTLMSRPWLRRIHQTEGYSVFTSSKILSA